jgi:C4-dicarboxylate-specific signal transduction histidine kinase
MNPVAAMSTFKDSVEAFGDAAADELARSGSGYKAARVNMVKHYRQRKAEITNIAEAFSRRPWSTPEQMAIRQVADHALVTLEAIYRDMRLALDTLHKD